MCYKDPFNLLLISEILKTAHLTPFFDNTKSILYSLPANTNTNGYCAPKNWFQTRVFKISDIQQ